MKQQKGPRRLGGRVAGDYRRHPDCTDAAVEGNGTPVNDFQVAVEAERILLATGWSRPAELASVAAALGLRVTDFSDRLVSVVVDYLRLCGERAVKPTLPEAVALLASRAVPHADGELYRILQDTPVPGTESLVDLVADVQRAADERTDELLRSLARDAFRAVSHAFNCRDCISCQRTRRPSKAGAGRPQHDRARRPPTYV